MANPPTITAVAETADTAAAIAQRLKRENAVLPSTYFVPTPGGAFTHSTTLVSTLIPAILALGLTTSVTSGNLIAATTALQDQVNALTKAVNKMVYTLESNGMTS